MSASPTSSQAYPHEVFSHPDVAATTSWKAHWIGLDVPSSPNQWIAYRQDVTLRSRPHQAVAKVAVDSKYWLWINGELVVREGGLKRGPTPSDTYFDAVDVSPHLREGENQIGVLVWHFGKHGFSHNNSGTAGLLFQLEGDNAILSISDSSWHARLHPAFAHTAAPFPNKRLPESNIRFDANLDQPGWQTDPVGTQGPTARDLGQAGSAPWNALVKRCIPQWRWYPISDYISIDQVDRANEEGTPQRVIVGKLPGNAMVCPFLEVEAPAGELIDIRTDNYLGGGEANVRAEFITREGRQSFECLGWMNGHEVHYRVPSKVKVVCLGYRETRFPAEPSGTFTCDNAFLNRLREKAVNTLLLTMRDSYMDCPDRERAQWWGDAVLELGEVSYALDRTADQLTRKAMLELIGWQRDDGVLYSPVPSGSWDQDLPLQSLASIGLYGFWHYVFHTGDASVLDSVYPGAMNYLRAWEMRDNGLVLPRKGAWPWGDWGENVDMEVLANAWYHLALQGQRNAALHLGRQDDLAWIDQRMRSIEGAFDQVFWTGSAYRSREHEGCIDDRANALAVVSGLARKEHYGALTRVLRGHEHASPYMEKYVLEALCRMNHAAMAQERIEQRYKKMVDHPLYTTLWEGWGIGPEGFGGGTINHAWSGGPLTLMSQFFAGIAPTQPGYASFSVLPQPGHLRKIAAVVQSPVGEISVTLSIEADHYDLKCIVPEGSDAVVGLPLELGEIQKVHVNGEVLWSEDDSTTPTIAVKCLGVLGDPVRHLAFKVPAGEWIFQADLKTGETKPNL